MSKINFGDAMQRQTVHSIKDAQIFKNSFRRYFSIGIKKMGGVVGHVLYSILFLGAKIRSI